MPTARPSKVNNPTQTVTYFDALGRAVDQTRSGVSTQIVYAPSGQKFAIMNGTTLNRYIDPMVAGMAAVYTGPNGTPPNSGYFQHADWLGSSRLAVTRTGTATYDRSYAPFGEPYNETATINRNFTGQTEDTTPGIYDFLFRQQSQSQGRWLVPDPAGLAPVDLTNPQTWNRYAYVGNNPPNTVDPLGMYCALPLEYGHYSVGCGSVGMGWGSGIFTLGYQWVSGSTQQPTQVPGTDPSGTDTPGWQMSQTNGGWQVVGMGLPGGSWGWTSSAAQSVSDWFKKSKTTITSGRQPGESFTHCVTRMKTATLGNTGAAVLDSVSGVGLASSILTVGQFATIPGAGSFFKSIGVARDASMVELLAMDAAAQGTLSAATVGTVSTVAGVVSKVAVPVTVGALGVEAGFAIACSF